MTETYDPDVSPGGPWSTRELAGLTIRKMSVSEMHNNVYLLTCRTSGAQLLIDAADEADRIRDLVAAGGTGLDHLVTTHQHWDHVRALVDVTKDLAPETHAGEDDASSLPQLPDHRLRHGDRIAFGHAVLDVVHLRGHTPGSVALAYDDPQGHVHLFSGDSLFPGGVGNTKMPGQSFEALYADVTHRVFDVYDDDTWVYPGHGSDTTLGAERPHLDEWRARGW
ncbi:MBL fold metallo-hydrolase [Janibacter limosus]|jgi:glyoxylase-like metal-dependent hydrolase (beta-lactamase superfamily II)|uniref:MBL fold metallo-hydrolase n=1 Tax=Janibacter limosus TaxID=53458 RepID=UPI00082AFE36|nr:MBL fold metallo-hydrolase [Janibacter limosus]